MKFFKDWKSICWGLALIGVTCILFVSMLAPQNIFFFAALGLFLIVGGLYAKHQLR